MADDRTPHPASDPALEAFPDPDEDNLDDLDALLDDFSSAKPDALPQAAQPVGPSKPKPLPDQEAEHEDLSLPGEDEFMRQLQAHMGDMFSQTDESPGLPLQIQEMLDQMEAAIQSAAQSLDEQPAAQADPPPGPDASFQSTIDGTVKRLEESGRTATEAAASASPPAAMDDMLAQMMQQFQQQAGAGPKGEDGADEDENMSKMLLGMMEELTNKEILYGPIKELDDRFPSWLDQNRSRTAENDLRRYDEQYGLVREMVARFEAPTYRDENPEDREFILDRMQKMQAVGAPPVDLVGNTSSAEDTLNLGETCNAQ